MADIVAKQEKVHLEVKHVTFDQCIGEEIINFNRASLTINANIDFIFAKTNTNKN